MTKPITSVAAMLLFEQDKFQLDDPIAKFLPEFENFKVLLNDTLVEPDHAPTIRGLTSHTADLTYGVFSNTEIDQGYREAIWGDRALLDLTLLCAEMPRKVVCKISMKWLSRLPRSPCLINLDHNGYKVSLWIFWAG